MNKILKITIVIILGVWSTNIAAQKRLVIGDKEIILQSPMRVVDKGEIIERDTVYVFTEVEAKEKKRKSYHRRSFKDIYFGMGGAIDRASFTKNEEFFPMYAGRSLDLQTGIKYYFRPARAYAIGIQLQYSFFSYSLETESAKLLMDGEIPGAPYSHYFRSDNLGIGLLNRFYLYRKIYLEIGVYGDISVSKRYMVKTMINGKKEKAKYWDEDKYNPLQAGVQLSLGFGCLSIYAKYRVTDMFNTAVLPNDPLRLNIGAMISF